MTTFRSILAGIISTVIGTIGALMIYAGYIGPDSGLFYTLGGLFLAIAWFAWQIIHPKGQEITARAQIAQAEARIARTKAGMATDKAGVHWFWWVAALCLVPALVGLPLLIVIAIIHVGRKNRATMREVTAAQ